MIVEKPGKKLSTGRTPSKELSWQARTVSGVFAACCGIPGIVGVFVEGTNTGGIPVLIAVAAFFGYLTVSGQRLLTFKVGNSEANFERVADRAAGLLDDPAVSDKARAEVVEVLDEFRYELPTRARRSLDSAIEQQRESERWQTAALESLRNVIRIRPGSGSSVSWNSATNIAFVRFDDSEYFASAARRGSDGQPVSIGQLVEVLNLLQMATASFEEDLGAENIGDCLLFISDRPPAFAESLKPITFGSSVIVFVAWRGPWDDKAISDGIDKLLTASGTD